MSGITTLIIIAAAMACTLGGVSLLAYVYNLNHIKSKTVGDGQHGTARWASSGEIKKTYRHIPYTPKKWREQARKGQTPTMSRPKKSCSERKARSSRKLCRKASWSGAKERKTTPLQWWIQATFTLL